MKIVYIIYTIYIASSLAPNGLQKVGYTAENYKWHNFSPDLGVTPRILFLGFRIFLENSVLAN